MMTIAIDGPAGSGKSSLAKLVANQLGLTYLDTGAMYRCVALISMESGKDPGKLAKSLEIQLRPEVRIGDRVVDQEIRTPEVSQKASEIATLSEVREAMVKKQQQIMREGGFVAEGRDIGTVVAPQAELKIFLTASLEERAKRRALQSGGEIEEVTKDLEARDRRDSSRSHSPLVPAADAIRLDNTKLTLEETAEEIIRLARKQPANP